ncbi:MAG: glucokinase [Pseudohongiellaceae bacterium]|nr:glucokinase [Pseudohongiellaceae bacterium]
MSQSVDKTCLIADVGGTHARFALSVSNSELLECVHVFRCSEFSGLESAIQAYLSLLADLNMPYPSFACFALAGPVHNNEIHLTNNEWVIDKQRMAQKFSFSSAYLNDFSAQGYCLPALLPAEIVQWQAGAKGVGTAKESHNARAIVGPGTGFGVCVVSKAGEVLESEMGQCTFAPSTPHELALLQCLWDSYARVSIEHLLSGSGIANIFFANVLLQGRPGMSSLSRDDVRAQDVVELARDGNVLAQRSMRDFNAILGSVCGDIALASSCLSGLFLTGAILDKIADVFEVEVFLERFCDKGSFRGWCKEVPIYRIKHPYPGLLGCSVYAQRNAEKMGNTWMPAGLVNEL